MKNFLVYALVILLFPTLVFAQNGLINSNQIAPVTVTVQAGEALTPGQVVSLINESGTVRAYNNPLTVSTSPNGAESVFNAAATAYCNAVALDTSRFIVVFQGAGSAPEAIVGTVSGSTISWGTKKTGIDAGTLATYLPICKIGTDKVLIAYGDGVGSKGRMCVLTISDTTITAGTPVDFLTANATYDSLTTLEDDKALLVYRAASDTYGRAKIITVSSTTPTPYPAAGTEGTIYNAAATAYNSVSALSSTSAIVAYQDGGNSDYGTAQVLSISGTTITPGTEYVFKEANTNYNYPVVLSATSVIMAYNSTTGFVRPVTISGQTITYDATETEFINDGAMNVTGVAVSSTKANLVYGKNASTSKAYTQIITRSGNTLEIGTAYLANDAISNYCNSCYLGGNKTILVYQDNGNSNYGTAVVNTAFNADYSSVRGLSTAAVNSGETATVLLSGMASGLSSITQGQQYWLNTDHTMSTAPVSLAIMKNSSTQTGEIFLGVGKSSTEMWFNVDYK